MKLKAKGHRISLTFNPDDERRVKKLAEAQECSQGEAIRRALLMAEYVNTTQGHNRVMVRPIGQDTLVEAIFP